MPSPSTAGARAPLAALLGAAAALLVLGSRGPVLAQDDSPTTKRSSGSRTESGFEELDERALAAIERGVAWLANAQTPNGRWACTPPRYQMSITALAGLALLAHGDTPETGRYAQQVQRTVRWVLSCQIKEKGALEGLLYDSTTVHTMADFDEGEDRPMHGHGFALLFLSEAYGQTRDGQLRDQMHDAIAAGCRLTERTISPDGGWFYLPGQQRDEGSVTITQIQALRSARDAGIAVDPAVVARAVDYVKGSQMEDGGVRYTRRWGKTSAALTAAGLSVFHGAGEYSGPAIDRGYAYLRANLRYRRGDDRFFAYTHLYASQAMFQRGGPEWANYFPRIRRELLDLRDGDAWDGDFGPAFDTAISLLILQLPLRYLPIFQR